MKTPHNCMKTPQVSFQICLSADCSRIGKEHHPFKFGCGEKYTTDITILYTHTQPLYTNM